MRQRKLLLGLTRTALDLSTRQTEKSDSCYSFLEFSAGSLFLHQSFQVLFLIRMFLPFLSTLSQSSSFMRKQSTDSTFISRTQIVSSKNPGSFSFTFPMSVLDSFYQPEINQRSVNLFLVSSLEDLFHIPQLFSLYFASLFTVSLDSSKKQVSRYFVESFCASLCFSLGASHLLCLLKEHFVRKDRESKRKKHKETSKPSCKIDCQFVPPLSNPVLIIFNMAWCEFGDSRKEKTMNLSLCQKEAEDNRKGKQKWK